MGMADEKYIAGDYLVNNPTWGVEDSAWKARKIMEMIQHNDLHPATICEVGCGAGEVLRQLQLRLPEQVHLCGWEIAPAAHQMCMERANPELPPWGLPRWSGALRPPADD
jgi:ubiquinone/menaquinone biosynthesis C-methylase UbiE